MILFRLAEHVPEQADAEMPDVPPEHWAHGAAALACRTEVMNLQPDGLFHPEQTVTGPELACALNRLTTHEAAAAVWPSLKAGWETAEISFAAGNGWVMGFDGETFDADAPLSRAQLAQILNALLGRTPASLDDLQLGMPIFDDNRDARAWYFLPNPGGRRHPYRRAERRVGAVGRAGMISRSEPSPLAFLRPPFFSSLFEKEKNRRAR